MRTKMFCVGIATVLAMFLSGCQSGQPNQPNWSVISPIIESVAQTGANLAFSQPAVAPHKAEICAAVKQVADVLENYNDPNATFDQLRQKILAALDQINISDPAIKQLIIGVVDDIASAAVAYVKTYYAQYIATNQGQVVLTVSKAVARGLNDACALKLMSKAPSFLFPQ